MSAEATQQDAVQNEGDEHRNEEIAGQRSRMIEQRALYIPFAPILWLLAAALFFYMSTIDFSLKDVQLEADLDLTQISAEDERPVVLDAVLSEYVFEEPDSRFSDVDIQGFIDELIALDGEGDRTEIESVATSELNRVVFTLSGDADADAFIERVGDVEEIVSTAVPALEVSLLPSADPAAFTETMSSIPVIQEIQNEGDGMFLLILNPGANPDVIANNNNAIRESTDDVEILEFVQVRALISAETNLDEFLAPFEEEAQAAQDAAEGEEVTESPIEFTQVIPVTRLTIMPTENGREGRIVILTEETLNSYFPRANLGPMLWVPTASLDLGGRIIDIDVVDTGIALFIFAMGFALIELIAGYIIHVRRIDNKLIIPLLRVVGVFLIFWSLFGHRPFWDFVLQNIFPDDTRLLHPRATVIQFAAEHLELVIVSSLITVPLGLLFGIIVTREDYREFLPLVNNIVNSGQTIPTLAIVAIMAPIIGLGFWPAIIALVLYGLLPVVRNTIVGLEGVPASIIDAAKGMGLTPTQILVQIELPIASRIIMAGVRTSMVVNVGTAALGAYVASGGLGTPIVSGLSSRIDPLVLLGAVPAALLAILIDYVLGRVEFVITPKGLQIES